MKILSANRRKPKKQKDVRLSELVMVKKISLNSSRRLSSRSNGRRHKQCLKRNSKMFRYQSMRNGQMRRKWKHLREILRLRGYLRRKSELRLSVRLKRMSSRFHHLRKICLKKKGLI